MSNFAAAIVLALIGWYISTQPGAAGGLNFEAIGYGIVGLGYLWFLAKIVARPKPLVKPVKDSKGWLIAQTVFSSLCTFLFGALTLWMLISLLTGGWGIYILVTWLGLPLQRMPFLMPLLLTLGVPLLFALSVRWARIVENKSNCLRRSGRQPSGAPTPEQVGQALAYYSAQLASGKSGKDILRLLNARVGFWGKSRRRHVRASLEVLMFCAWLCQRTTQERKLLEAFYSSLTASIPPEWKSLVANAPPVQVKGLVWDFRTFTISRCYKYEEARKLGPNSPVEWARILTHDVPDLRVEPMALLQVSLIMSGMFTAHLLNISKIARQGQAGTASAQA